MQTRPRLLRMFAHGTTTAEAKTGYGLQTATELRLLKALLALDDEGPLDLAITFLGAHAIAPEFKDDPQGYTDLICETMLPMLGHWWETTLRACRCLSWMSSARQGLSTSNSRVRS